MNDKRDEEHMSTKESQGQASGRFCPLNYTAALHLASNGESFFNATSLSPGHRRRHFLIQAQDIRLRAHGRDAVRVDLLMRLGVVLQSVNRAEGASLGLYGTFLTCSNCVVSPKAG